MENSCPHLRCILKAEVRANHRSGLGMEIGIGISLVSSIRVYGNLWYGCRSAEEDNDLITDYTITSTAY